MAAASNHDGSSDAQPPSGARPETVERYLDVAARLVDHDVATEPAFAHVASHVRLTAVARNLGVSRTSLYRLWATQHDYWSDLVTFMIRRPPATPIPAGTAGDGAPDDLDGLLEVLRVEGAEVQEHLVTDPRRILATSLLGYPPVEALRAELAAAAITERQRAAARLDERLAAAGLAVRPPLTSEDLLAAIWILADGVAHCAAIDPAYESTRLRPDGPGTPAWTLTGYAARCIVATLTQPAEGRRRTPTAEGSAPSEDPVADRRWTPPHVAALEEGARQFAEHVRSPAGHGDTSTVLGHVTLARVARAAGVTRRQLYHLWSSQEDFLRDLRAHMRRGEAAEYRARFDDGIAAALERLDVTRVALEVADHINRGFEAWDDRPVIRPRFAFEMHLADPAVAADSCAALDRAMAFHQERIDALLAATGVAVRSGVTTEDVNRLFTASAHGSEVLHRIDPTAVRPGLPYRGGAYSTHAIACQAIVDHSLDPGAAPET